MTCALHFTNKTYALTTSRRAGSRARKCVKPDMTLLRRGRKRGRNRHRQRQQENGAQGTYAHQTSDTETDHCGVTRQRNRCGFRQTVLIRESLNCIRRNSPVRLPYLRAHGDPGKPITVTGTAECQLTVPLPNCPDMSHPQHLTAPSRSGVQLWWPCVAIDSALWVSNTLTGTDEKWCAPVQVPLVS